jgi:chromosome segregation ATPase
MLNAGGNKGKTERRGRKAESRKQTGGQQSLEAEPRPDELLDAREQINEQISAPVASIDQLPDAQEQINEQIGAPVASIDQLPDAQEQVNEQISAPVASSEISSLETSATDIIPTVPAVSAEPVVASIATIANAYGAYTGKSVELTWSFLEKLAAVRSLDKAFEVQTEFAKQVFETFLAESRKIHELHSELARQRVVHFEGFVARITQTTFVLRATYP